MLLPFFWEPTRYPAWSKKPTGYSPWLRIIKGEEKEGWRGSGAEKPLRLKHKQLSLEKTTSNEGEEKIEEEKKKEEEKNEEEEQKREEERREDEDKEEKDESNGEEEIQGEEGKTEAGIRRKHRMQKMRRR